MIGTRLVARIGIQRTMFWGALLLAAGGGLMLGLAVYGGVRAWEVVVPMMLYMVGVGLAFPQAIAAAMMPYPDRAGAASSLLGFCQMTSGAVTGVIVANAYDGSGLPLALAVAIMGFAALALNLWERLAYAPAPGE